MAALHTCVENAANVKQMWFVEFKDLYRVYVTVRVSNQGFSQIPKTFRESVKFLFRSRIWSLNV